VNQQRVDGEQRVTPLELFFDLVFVFGFTQVTTVLSDDPTWGGLGHGLLILAALWWAWAAYAWLTNTVDPGEGLVWGSDAGCDGCDVRRRAGRSRRLRPPDADSPEWASPEDADVVGAIAEANGIRVLGAPGATP
jgi:hypothetical protein